eukprot:gene11627-4869_t
MKSFSITLFIVLVSIVSAQNQCRFTAPRSTQCKEHTVKACSNGSIVWPYPMETCKFKLTAEKNQKKVQLVARAAPISWIVENLKGKELAKGNGFLNKTIEFKKSKGVIVHLTYPTRVNLFQMNLYWIFEK